MNADQPPRGDGHDEPSSKVPPVREKVFARRKAKMSMVLQMSSESGCLCVKATGRFSLAEAKRTFLEILEAAARNKVGRVLFDGQELKGNPETIERFYHGAFTAHATANRGMRVKAFDNIDDARGWLDRASANPADPGVEGEVKSVRTLRSPCE